MTITLVNGPTIAKNGAISDALDCTSGTLVRITMPPDWTSAPLSFMISPDGVVPYTTVCNSDGKERILAVMANSTILGTAIPASWVKFRSGTSQKPVSQANTRAFMVAIDKP
jgi:hypothetical protein